MEKKIKGMNIIYYIAFVVLILIKLLKVYLENIDFSILSANKVSVVNSVISLLSETQVIVNVLLCFTLIGIIAFNFNRKGEDK